MYLCRVVCGLSLYERSSGSIEVASRDGTFGEKLFATIDDALVEIEIGLGLRKIQFGFLIVFRYLGTRGYLIGSLCCCIASLVVENSRCEVTIFKNRQQFA